MLQSLAGLDFFFPLLDCLMDYFFLISRNVRSLDILIEFVLFFTFDGNFLLLVLIEDMVLLLAVIFDL